MAYELLVGNLGIVYEGDNLDRAIELFQAYAERSLLGSGRGAGEPVVLMTSDGHVLHEYTPADPDDADYN